MDYIDAKFEDLVGKTIVRIDKLDDEYLYFHTEDGETYLMSQTQDCGEAGCIKGIVGDLNDLIGSPILRAEVSTCKGNGTRAIDQYNWALPSIFWTFYKLTTLKGYVDIGWFAARNGYYCAEVDFDKLDKDKNKWVEKEWVNHKHEVYNGEQV